MNTDDALDVLVIGGGQAGLVMGHHLARRGLRVEILEASAEVGDAWRSRWDSLRLFTAAQYNDLPGMPFPAPPDTYPGKDEVADFLRAYAARFELPVRLNARVRSLTRDAGVYVVETEAGSFAARQVVVATGPFQVPHTPPLADQLDPELAQVHSATYRGPESLPPGRGLVVGAANSGAQIALELSATRAVDISTGERLPTVPQRPLGRDVWWWGQKLGITRLTVDSRLGRRMSGRDVVIGGGLRELRRHGVGVRGRAVAAAGRTVTFADGESAEYDGIVWATGFRLDHSWIGVPGVKDEGGRVIHRRGVTPAPGLYVLGLTWQYKRTSALLGWVTEDAEFIAEWIEATKETTERSERGLAEVSE